MADTLLRSLAWWHSELSELPDAAALGLNAWTRTGAGSVVVQEEDTHGGGARITVAGGPTYFQRPPHPRDPRGRGAYELDDMQIQATVRGYSFTAAWPGGVSPIVLALSDGQRAMGVSIGDTLRIIDPVSGAATIALASGWDWQAGHVYRLKKVGTALWELWIDGEPFYEVGYLDSYAAPAAGFNRSFYRWGALDPGGSADALFQGVEIGLNRSVAPAESVDRALLELPGVVQRLATPITRGLLRTVVSGFEDKIEWLRRAARAVGAVRRPQVSYTLTGQRRPADEDPGWTEVSPGNISVVRQRVRCAGPGAGTQVSAQSIFAAAAWLPSEVEVSLRARVSVFGAYTADAQGRVGPFLLASDGMVVTALLIEDGATVAGDGFAWILAGDTLSGAITQLGEFNHRVDPRVEHEVELRIIGGEQVLLLIDGEIVERIPYSALVHAGPAGVDIGCVANAVAVVDIGEAVADRATSDLSRRPTFEQDFKERRFAISGCERNDEIAVWSEHHHGVQRRRGTRAGIVAELKRLACTSVVRLVDIETPARWFLEVTYPEVTPTYLDLTDNYIGTTIEFEWGTPPNLTPQQVADHAAEYIVPVSRRELEFSLAIATTITGAPTVPSAGLHRLPVVSSAGFEVGQTLQARDSGTGLIEESVIQAIPSTTAIDVNTLSFAFGATDVARVILATT